MNDYERDMLKYNFHSCLKKLDLRQERIPYPALTMNNLFIATEHAWEWQWFNGLLIITGEKSRKPPNRWHRFWAWFVFGAKFRRIDDGKAN